MLIRKIAFGLLLSLIPVVAVQVVSQTAWGPILASPQSRQYGDPNAKVVIVEYSDFQCPSCAHAVGVVHSLADAYKGRVRLAYKYFPLTKIHRNALPAAHAAQCAAAQNHFWPYHDQLFSTQSAWASLPNATTSFLAIAEKVQLDLPRWSACYADPEAEKAIQADIVEGQRRVVQATPTFFVGSERLVGPQLEAEGAQTIERELRR